MAKDPAFLFYPGDYLRDTQNLSEPAQVAYDRIMCEHMRNICKDMSNITITQGDLNFFTKRLDDIDKERLEKVLVKHGDGYQIEWVAESISKRASYSESRRKNRSSKGKKISKTYVEHMENEDEIENESIVEDEISIEEKKELERLKENEELWNWFQKEYTSQFKKIDDDFDFVVSQCQLKIDKMKVEDKPQSVKQIKATLESYLNNWIYNKNQNGKAKRANKGHRSTARVDTSRGPGKL